IGILTIKEKWEKYCERAIFSNLTEAYLSVKYPLQKAEENILVNGCICPTESLVKEILALEVGESLVQNTIIIAQKVKGDVRGFVEGLKDKVCNLEFRYIDRPWKIFSLNHTELENDFDLITRGRKSAPISASNTILGNRIF